MSLLFIEGFDTYATGNWTNKWTSQGGAIGATGREGTNGLSGGTSADAVRAIGTKQEVIVGMALKIDTSKSWRPIALRDGATIQLAIELDATNQIIIKRGTTTLKSTGYSLLLDTWYYIEFRGKIDQAPDGEWELHVNGSLVDSQTGVDTQQTGGAQVTNVSFFHFTFGSGGWWMDDLYIFDTDGSFCNDFVGDVHVEASFPDGAGYVADWVGTPVGGNNYDKVDETDPNDDTDFVATSGIGYEDSYDFASIVSTSGSVYGVQVNLWGKKDDVGDRQVNAIIRPISTTYSGGAAAALASTYGYHVFEFESNPETSDYWTIAEINASEFGIKLEA